MPLRDRATARLGSCGTRSPAWRSARERYTVFSYATPQQSRCKRGSAPLWISDMDATNPSKDMQLHAASQLAPPPNHAASPRRYRHQPSRPIPSAHPSSPPPSVAFLIASSAQRDMRLVDVHTLERTESVDPPPSATPSHRWTDEEVSSSDYRPVLREAEYRNETTSGEIGARRADRRG